MLAANAKSFLPVSENSYAFWGLLSDALKRTSGTCFVYVLIDLFGTFQYKSEKELCIKGGGSLFSSAVTNIQIC